MTLDDVAVDHNLLRGRFIVAYIANSSMAAGTKRAAFGRLHGAGQITLQHDFAQIGECDF